MLGKKPGRRLRLKWELSGEQEVGGDTERVEIGAAIHVLAS